MINKEIDNSSCNNCIYMDNNLLYLNNRLQNLYLDILKENDNILDNTYNEIQNIKEKNVRIDIGNIIHNKKKLDNKDISYIKQILLENCHEMPHISQLFRNKIIDPLVEYMKSVKEEYNEFIQLVN